MDGQDKQDRNLQGTSVVGVPWSEGILPSMADSRGYDAVIFNMISDAKETTSP